MAKFCRSCGAPIEEGAEKCSACGVILNREAAAAAKAQQTNDTLNKVSDVINTIFCVVEKVLRIAAAKVSQAVKNLQAKQAANAANPANPAAPSANDSKLNVVRLAIIAVMIVLALIGTIMNLTMKYEIPMKVTMSYNGEKESMTQSSPIGDLAESDEFIFFTIVNVLWAVFNVVIIVLAALVLLKVLKLVNTDKKFKSLAFIGLIGDVLYMIIYKIAGAGSESVFGVTMKYSAGFHFFVWIHIVVFALVVAWNFISLKPAAPAAVDAPAAE